jgi:uncharacterized repeat protein (TIGR01451 family)
MKKIVVWLFVSVLVLQLVCAGEIFSGEVKDNVPFTINDISHNARYYPSAKKVSLMAGTDRVLIAVGECQEINGLKYCIDSAVEGFDDETGDPASTMELRVLQSGPDITIDRDVTDESPGLNEEVEFTVTLTNNGNERASNIIYEDNFPSSVKVSSAYYSAITNGISWTGSIEKGKSQTIKYKIRLAEFKDFESVAQVSFLWNGKVNKVKSSSIDFSVSKPYRVSDSMSAKSVGLNEDIIYTLSLNNTNAAGDIIVDKIEVIFPKGVTSSYRDMEWEVGDGKLTYKGKVSANSGKSLSFRFKSLNPLQGKIATKVMLRSNNEPFEEDFEHAFGIGISDVLPEITIKPSPVKGGGELEVEAKITNNGESTVSGISLDMASDLVDIRGWRDLELEPGKKHYAFNKIINAPSIDEEKTFFLKLSGSYRSAAGKTMKFEAMEQVTVTPQDKVLELTPDIKIDGKDVNVTLKVKNVAQYKLTYVSLIDTFPTGFRSSVGSRDIDIEELNIGEERTAYSYIVRIPDAYTKKSFDITHTVNALDKDESKIMYEKKTAVQLGEGAAAEESKTGTAAADESASNATAQANATGAAAPEEAEKPGIFKRMWSWIKGLFGGDDAPEDSFE